LVIGDWNFLIYLVQHALQEFAVAFNLSVLSMCFWADGCTVDRKTLEEAIKLGAIQLRACIHL
jgi:hypothetical protein